MSISKTLYIGGVGITDDPPAIPAGTTALGNWALAGFDGLADVVIPTGVQTVGVGAFSGCDSMTSLTIPIAGVTFNGSVEWMKLLFITEFTADAGQAYAIPAGLKTIRLTGNITDLPGATFDGFTALETVILPSSLQTIGVNAFNGCTALTTVNIPAGVTKIGANAFSGCTALTSVDFVTTEGWYTSDPTATSGTALLATDLKNTATAATYLKTDYVYYVWKRS